MEEVYKAQVECLQKLYNQLREENGLLLEKLRELLDKESEIEQEWYSNVCKEIRELLHNINGC